MKPLTVGNVVSAGLRIYRDRFSDYYKLAFVGYLWLLVPVYGWGKYCAMMGAISRLAFGEVTEKPEPIRDAQRFVKPRAWSFFGAGILVSLIVTVAMIVLAIILGVAIAILGSAIGQAPSGISVTIGIIFTLVAVLIFLFSFTWLTARLLIVEIPLAIEEDVNATEAISRSWKLTKGSLGFVFRLQSIILVGILISLPITVAIQLFSFIIGFVLGAIGSSIPELSSLLSSIFSLAIAVVGGALLIPFWQSIKAVIYYDLRVRKEGLGLNLEKS